jgi:hypothetical protein
MYLDKKEENFAMWIKNHKKSNLLNPVVSLRIYLKDRVCLGGRGLCLACVRSWV